jgi:hypothetical protein
VYETRGRFSPIWVVPQKISLLSLFFQGRKLFVFTGKGGMPDAGWVVAKAGIHFQTNKFNFSGGKL